VTPSAVREALAAHWPSAVHLGKELAQARGGDDRATTMHRSGLLLAVFVAHPTPSYRYPIWQFHPDGQPAALLAEVLVEDPTRVLSVAQVEFQREA